MGTESGLFKMRCSNCGKMNRYNKETMDKVFPYSRERLDCKHCKRSLSVCSGFLILFLILILPFSLAAEKDSDNNILYNVGGEKDGTQLIVNSDVPAEEDGENCIGKPECIREERAGIIRTPLAVAPADPIALSIVGISQGISFIFIPIVMIVLLLIFILVWRNPIYRDIAKTWRYNRRLAWAKTKGKVKKDLRLKRKEEKQSGGT